MSNRKNYDFDMMISSNRISDHSFVHKFGAVPGMSVGNNGTIWDVNDTMYPWDALDPATNIHITNNIADAGLQVVVQGLDANFEEVSETITLTGEDTAGTVSFHRVNRAFIASGDSNTQDVNIHAGAGNGTIVARITANLGQTLMAVYTIPANRTGYLYQSTMTVGSSGDASGFMYFKYYSDDSTGNPFRIGHTFEVQGEGGQHTYNFTFPIPLPAKTDIDIRATTRTNNVRASAAFDILLVADDAEI